jgi:hypothetical protein
MDYDESALHLYNKSMIFIREGQAVLESFKETEQEKRKELIEDIGINKRFMEGLNNFLKRRQDLEEEKLTEEEKNRRVIMKKNN